MEEKKVEFKQHNRGLKFEHYEPDHKFYKRKLKGVETPVNLDGNLWFNNLPDVGEIQKSDKTDFMDCVTEGFVNALQTVLKARYGEDEFKSKRYTAKMSGTTQSGNTQAAVVASIGKDGVVPESLWPRDRTMDWNTYYQQPFSTVIEIGRGWAKKKYKVTGQPIWMSATDTKANMRTLDHESSLGVVCVTLYAWSKHADGMYYDEGQVDDHNVFYLRSITLQDGRKATQIFDSYPDDFQIDQDNLQDPIEQEFIKTLEPNFHIGSAMRLIITPVINQPNILKRMIDTIMAWFDQHGLNLAYVPKDSKGNVIGKQVIDMSNTNQKLDLLLKGFYDNKYFKNTDWPTVKKIKDLSPEQMIK